MLKPFSTLTEKELEFIGSTEESMADGNIVDEYIDLIIQATANISDITELDAKTMGDYAAEIIKGVAFSNVLSNQLFSVKIWNECENPNDVSNLTNEQKLSYVLGKEIIPHLEKHIAGLDKAFFNIDLQVRVSLPGIANNAN